MTPPNGRSRLRIGGWVPSFPTSGDDASTAGPATGDPPTAELPGDHHPPGGSSWFADPPAPTSVDYQPDPDCQPDPDYSHDSYEDPGYHLDPGADPDELDGGAGAGAYQGRRRADRPVAWSRRAVVASVAAVAVGVLLVGVGMLGQALTSGPSPLPAPPTPPVGVDPSPDRTTDRQGSVSTGSPGSPGASPVPSSADPPPSTTYEAEAADPGSHGQVSALAGASGGQVVRLSGQREGTFVQFTGVTVPAPGRYRLTIFYHSGQRRAGTLTVNGGEPESFTFPSRGAEGGIGSVSLSVRLGEGDNTIWVGTDGGAPVSLDRIAVGG